MQTPMLPNDPHIEVKLKLYGLLIDQLQKYNSILWQAPAALLVANILALDRLAGKPSILLAVGFSVLKSEGSTALADAVTILSEAVIKFDGPRFRRKESDFGTVGSTFSRKP
jgi:hypothetical protein